MLKLFMLKDNIDLNIDVMDNNIADVISKLKFVGHVQKGEKINVRHMYVQPDTLFTRIARTFFSPDNRASTYNFLETIINRGFELINLTLSKSPLKSIDTRLITSLSSDLDKSISGITNLRETYSNDIMFCCKLDALVEFIRSKLDDLQETINTVKLLQEADDINNVD